MKKMIVMIGVAALSVSAFARGCGGGGCGGGGGCWRPCGPCYRPCRPYPGPCGPCWRGGDWWGRGGCNFWPGFVGGLVGSVVANSVSTPTPSTVVVQQPAVVTQPVVVQQPTVVTQPVVVQQPVTTTQSVWVEGRYVDTVQANGSVVRTWQPGHYEQRTVVVR